jgi:phosphatidylinositol glycan class A protein
VSTAVGGVPEVLPPHMVTLAAPTPDDVLRALGEALDKVARGVDAQAQHAEVARLYSWPDVAARTAAVYDAVRAAPPLALSARFLRLARGGPVFGPITAILAALVHLMALLLDVLAPAEDMDPAPRLPRDGAAWAGEDGALADDDDDERAGAT